MTKVRGLSAAFDGVRFRAWIQVRAAVAFGVLALIAIPAHQVQAGCASVITACGCTITDAALHTIANNIFASDGLTAKGDCIDIKHKGAKLDGGFFEVDGDGATGVGIRILPGATKVAVQNFDGIFGWDIGIEDDANGATITDFDTDDNGTAGVVLNSVEKTVLSGFDSSASTGVGLLLKSSNGNQIDAFDTSGNGADGVRLNKSERNALKVFTSSENAGNGVFLNRSTANTIGDFTASANGGDGVLLDKSSGNSVIDYSASDNVADGVLLHGGSGKNKVGDASVEDNGSNGVEVAGGNKSNSVFFTTAIGNVVTDLVDGNAGCDNDVWSNNCFNTQNKACIGTQGSRC